MPSTENLRQKDVFMKIGYVRISKQEQNEALQIDALKEAGCEKFAHIVLKEGQGFNA
jgi:DNA invertase Pin-like site-specific DNA recombinase